MEGGELEPRVSALEDEMREIRVRLRTSEQDSAAARVLAGAADRDVGEIRSELRDFRQATAASFNAMREDFADLRGDVGRLRGEMRSKFDMTAAGQQQIVGMLQTLIDREDGP
jgi:chromosome segregation ATPase